MKSLVGKTKIWFSGQLSNLPHLIIRLTAIAFLYSHIIGYQQRWKIDEIISFITLPNSVYYIFFWIILAISVYVIIVPKKAHLLVIGMVVLALLNIQVMTPFWYNYILLLIFAKIDSSMHLIVWLLGVQEVWAGLGKLNGNYAGTISFFAEPFKSNPVVYKMVIIITLLVPLFEIMIGFGILFKKSFTRYLTLLVHGGAIIILAGFIHYGSIVWIWNLLIVLLVWLLYSQNISASISLSKRNLGIVAVLIFIPLLQIVTTITYPMSYRMYTGNEIQLTIDGKSYLNSYYKKTKSIAFLSTEVFQVLLKRKCLASEFTHATITVPKFLLRERKSISYVCFNNNLSMISNPVR
jgi:hypothetical protein